MHIFIPSKNRASQLDLLLRSIYKNMLFLKPEITVLYKATNSEFEEGYNKLKKKFKVDTNFIQEQSFEQQFSGFINGNYNGTIGIFTDDCVVYNNLDVTSDEITSLLTKDVWCFSTRLGLNTTLQYYVTGQKQEHLSKVGYEKIGKNFIKWNWKIRQRDSNYGYPFSWDGCFYKGCDLSSILKEFSFCGPRDFESAIYHRAHIINKTNIVAPVTSSTFVLTCNCVQEPPIPAGIKYPMSAEHLNKEYLNDNLISLKSLEKEIVTGSHHEFKVVLENAYKPNSVRS
jgi:hypothetical protein